MAGSLLLSGGEVSKSVVRAYQGDDWLHNSPGCQTAAPGSEATSLERVRRAFIGRCTNGAFLVHSDHCVGGVGSHLTGPGAARLSDVRVSVSQDGFGGAAV